MKTPAASLFATPLVTPQRIALAFLVGALADGIELFLTPLLGPGAQVIDTVVDVIALVLLSRLLGFHFALLPTFCVELVPVLDLMPTWMAATTYVVNVRRKEQNIGAPVQPDAAPSPSPHATSKPGL